MGAIEDNIRSIFKIPKDLELSLDTVFVFSPPNGANEREELTARELIDLVTSVEFESIFNDTGTTGRVDIIGLTSKEFIYFFK